MNPIIYRSNESWEGAAAGFCKQVNSTTPLEKLISVSGTLGNYDDTAIFIAHASSITVH
jgi:hypothetical protein